MTVQSYLRGAHSQRLAQTVIKSSNKKLTLSLKNTMQKTQTIFTTFDKKLAL
jgi:hypothetical protein